MLTLLLYFLALLVVGGLLFVLASFAFGRGEELAPMPPDASPVVLPAARRVTGRDLHRLRLSVVVRGYRMSEVDWLLDRLAREVDERDREIARLRQEHEGGAPADQAEPSGDRRDGGDPGDADPGDHGDHGDPADHGDRTDGGGGNAAADRDAERSSVGAAEPGVGEATGGWQAP